MSQKDAKDLDEGWANFERKMVRHPLTPMQRAMYKHFFYAGFCWAIDVMKEGIESDSSPEEFYSMVERQSAAEDAEFDRIVASSQDGLSPGHG